ncbi:ABC transporter permease [Comamonas testosteroni]|uniref:ABC transporter permease n=1 Tax=Comamonas testosteroni TaxID=285 RepID=UPI002DB8E0F2|nr:ABC transporter permease [Comamonas testosteroni]MEB5967387.1 ABC transporter permease [Comamonas testosteroni]
MSRFNRWRLSPRWGMLMSSPLAVASCLWLVLILALAFVAAPLVIDAANQQDISLRFLAPFHLEHGFSYLLGADSLGRPILLQLIVGARTSVVIAICAVGISAFLGCVIGLVAGFFGGWVDNVLLRIADVLHTIPSLLMALVVLFVLQPSVLNLIIVLGITRIPVYLRTSRTQTMEVKERMFVEVARAIGASNWRIITKDILPLVLPTIRTLAMLEVAAVMLAAASLTFLGIGLQRPDVDWGMMVADGRAYLRTAWFVAVFPGVVIVLTALSANVLSNWLRAVEDPAQSTLFFRSKKKKVGGAK